MTDRQQDKDKQDNLIEHVRGARAYIVDAKHPSERVEDLKLAAFMAIFHPNYKKGVQRDDR